MGGLLTILTLHFVSFNNSRLRRNGIASGKILIAGHHHDISIVINANCSGCGGQMLVIVIGKR